MKVKAINNLDELIEQNLDLSEDIRGEAMTIAEAFEQRGEKRGEQRGEKKSEKRGEKKSERKLVLNMLKNGMTVKQIAKFTELDLSFIKQVKEQQHNSEHSN